MKKVQLIWLIYVLVLFKQYNIINSQSIKKPPHIIFISVDDLGFSDIGFHGATDTVTPNIDAFHAYGIGLNRHYTAPMCTPSRAAFMTGKYPESVGMQYYVIPNQNPFGLPVNEKILPEYLKEAGYKTHLIGKWHLGFHEKKYAPTNRGFDSFYGCLGSFITFYNHTCVMPGNPSASWVPGYDMRKNMDTTYETQGQYLTDVLTNKAVETIKNHPANEPLFMFLSHVAPHSPDYKDKQEAPPERLERFSYISDYFRRYLAAMVSVIDDGVGKVVNTLKETGMLENSVIVFLSDNGAPVDGLFKNGASSYPYRGQKDSPWEGGSRSVAAIWSPLLKNRQRVSHQLMHLSDWLPTFAGLAGVNIPATANLDGKNMWNALSQGTNGPRDEVLIHLDDITPYTAYIKDHWKYVNGTTSNGRYDGWVSDKIDRSIKNPIYNEYAKSVIDSDVGKAFSYFSLESNKLSITELEQLKEESKIECHDRHIGGELFNCNPLKKPCLFDLKLDPCERYNLADLMPYQLARMEERVKHFRSKSLPSVFKQQDLDANPGHFNDRWTYWTDEKVKI